MSEKPKRHFWQIHLSTAVLLSVVAGAGIGLNLYPTQHISTLGSSSESITLEKALEYDKTERQVKNGLYCQRILLYGWPLPAFTYSDVVLPRPEGWLHDEIAYGRQEGWKWASWETHGIRNRGYGERGLLVDFAVFLMLCFSVITVSELVIRNHSRH